MAYREAGSCRAGSPRHDGSPRRDGFSRRNRVPRRKGVLLFDLLPLAVHTTARSRVLGLNAITAGKIVVGRADDADRIRVLEDFGILGVSSLMV
jgi:hypothetical protein